MGLSTQTGSPRPVRIAGREYLVPKFTPRMLGRISAWLETRTPNPKDVARRHIEGLPDGIARHIWDVACREARDWPPSFGNDEGRRLLQSPEGQSQILFVLLSRTVAGFTMEQADALADEMSDDEFSEVMRAAGAEYAPPRIGGDDPKAGGAGATTTAAGASSSTASP